MMLTGEIKGVKETVRALNRAPRDDIADGFLDGARKAMQRYRGFHRKRRMSRKSISDPVGIYAQGKRNPRGLKQDKWFPVKAEKKGTLEGTNARIRTRHAILLQLEHGKTLTKPGMVVPLPKHQTKKGKTSSRSKKLLKARKLFLFTLEDGRKFLVERKRTTRKLEFHFLVTDKIKIPKRLEFEDLFKTYGKQAAKVIKSSIGVVIRKFNERGRARSASRSR